jgi:hypothetical protein
MDWQLDGDSLLEYDKMRRAWFINLTAYANVHVAKGWLKRYQVTIAVLRAARAKLMQGA